MWKVVAILEIGIILMMTALLLEPDMEMLGFQVTNCHTSTSRCGGDDTTDDEVKGLFRFLAGQGFFDYDRDVQLRQTIQNNRIKRSCSR